MWRIIAKERLHLKIEKVLCLQDNPPCHRPTETMTIIHEYQIEFLPQALYSPDLTPSDLYLLAGSNNEVNAETKFYFVTSDESFYKKDTGIIEKPWNVCSYC